MVRHTELSQNVKSGLSDDCVESLDQIDENNPGVKSMLLALLQSERSREGAVDSVTQAPEPSLCLQSFYLHYFHHPVGHDGGNDFGCQVE